MANLKVIKKRIGTVKNTQKITKAMKMVAAAKLRRAQSAVLASRPFLGKLEDVVKDISEKLPEKDRPVFLKPRREVKNIKVFVFSSNRGLCGGFNSGVLKFAQAFLKEKELLGVSYDVELIGKKAGEFFKAKEIEFSASHEEWATEMSFETAKELSKTLVDQYAEESFDECYFIYNRFQSAISQIPTCEKLLPVAFDTDEDDQSDYGIDFIYEPSKQEILNELLPKYLASKIQIFHRESLASELGARMSAMESATKNASEMIDKLTLQYNRARQAAITTELLDIVNGAEALKA